MKASDSSFPFELPLFLDGGTGTHLIAAGLPEGVCVEQWIIDHPDVITKLQRSYVAAGSNAVYAPTFGANRAKLASYGFEGRVEELNAALVKITRDAVGNDVLVGGDISPTGLFIPPYGDTPFDEIVDIYRQQAVALVNAGVDFIGFETMLSLWECRAALLASRDLGVPVFVSITVDGAGRTLMGATLPACVVVLQELGAAAIGINCSEGPDGLEESFYRAAVCAKVPLIAKPNAGRPDPNDTNRFDLSVEQFAEKMVNLAKAGASIFGGCCGTGPEHIAAIRNLTLQPRPYFDDSIVCANEGNVFFLPEEWSALFPSEPLECTYSLEDDLIDMEDDRFNCAVVRVETEDDAMLLSELAPVARLPISILCDDEQVLDIALRNFHGRALVDGNSLLDREVLREVAARYGAVVY